MFIVFRFGNRGGGIGSAIVLIVDDAAGRPVFGRRFVGGGFGGGFSGGGGSSGGGGASGSW